MKQPGTLCHISVILDVCVCVFVCVCRHMYICSNMHHYNISHQYTHRERGWKKDRPGRQRERVSFQHPVLPLPRGRFKRSVWGPMRLRLEPPGLTSGDRGTGKCFCRWNRWFYLTHRLTPNFQRLYPGCWEQPGLIFGLQLEITKMICIGFWWILMSCNWPRLRYGHARMAHVLHKFLQGYPWVLAAHPPLGPEAGKTGESSRNGMSTAYAKPCNWLGVRICSTSVVGDLWAWVC